MTSVWLSVVSNSLIKMQSLCCLQIYESQLITSLSQCQLKEVTEKENSVLNGLKSILGLHILSMLMVLSINIVFFLETIRDNLSQLVSTPLTLWTSATSKFQFHKKKNQFHASAVQNVVKRMSELKSLSISQTLSGISQERIARNREIIKLILRGVIYLARQNITYRGHRDDSKHIKLERPGNFQAMLDLLAENGNDVLRRHFETSPLNASYRSKTIQGEMIDVCGKFISEALVNRVRSLRFFFLYLLMKFKTKVTRSNLSLTFAMLTRIMRSRNLS